MNTQQTENDNVPLTRGDLKQFCAVLCEGLNPRKTGDVALPHEIIGLHSDAPAEHDETGQTRVRLFDLIGGRTGVERDDGRVYFAD